jgi:chitin disaccharide deacetylase
MRVVLHADDFGQNAAVNDGILRGFDRGLLTSTSLLANAPAARQAIDAWRMLVRRQQAGMIASAESRATLGDNWAPFDLGVHLNLTQGRPLTGARYPELLLDDAGRFPGVVRTYRRLRGRVSSDVISAIHVELESQISLLVDNGIRPTHVNGHQYVEMIPRVAALVPELLERFGIHVLRVAEEPGLTRSTVWQNGRIDAWLLALVKRRFARRLRGRLKSTAARSPSQYFGTAHAGRITAPVIARFLKSARPPGMIEIGMHPAVSPTKPTSDSERDGWRDPLAFDRPAELALLESVELRDLLRSRKFSLGRLAELKAA